MKKFLTYTSLFILLVAGVFMAMLFRAGFEVDEFYGRFTTPKQHAFILGTSRAAQGLNPEVLNQELHRNDFFNYSFTNEHSPYGPVYLKSIQQKHAAEKKDGIFILTVDPWNVGSDKNNPDDEKLFRENELMLSGMWSVNSKPNFLYLLKYYDGSYFNILTKKQDSQLHLHENGWLEVIVPTDSASVSKRTRERMKLYREETLQRYSFSSTRLSWLGKTAEYLRQYGKVYLVRLPVSDEMLSIEMEQNKSFDVIIREFAREMNLPYLDISSENDQVAFTDGNHIARQSVADVSKRVADFVKSNP